MGYFVIFKTAIGSAFAIFLASTFGLMFEYSAGIITLLSIQNNKKDTITIAIKRLIGFFPMVILSLLVINFSGKSIVGFGIFLIIYILICNFLDLQEGIAINSVLCTQIFTSEIVSINLLLNQLMILIIGLSIGILVNLFMPDLTKKIRKSMFEIEEEMKKIFLIISSDLVNSIKICGDEVCNATIFNPTIKSVEQAMQKAEIYSKNNLFSDSKYFLKYLIVRKQQIYILQRIVNSVSKITVIPKQANKIAVFFEHLFESFHEYNNVESLTKELEEIVLHFKEEDLPKSREEFENRAIIYGVIQELETFLSIKRDFVNSLSQKEIEEFWKTKI